MTPKFSPELAAELVAQLRADDERMTPGEWLSKPGQFYLSWVVLTHGGEVVAERKHDMFGHDTAAIARTRNSLRAVAEMLEAACERIAELEANAISMREYRFALEGIHTDGSGNPVDGGK